MSGVARFILSIPPGLRMKNGMMTVKNVTTLMTTRLTVSPGATGGSTELVPSPCPPLSGVRSLPPLVLARPEVAPDDTVADTTFPSLVSSLGVWTD